MNLLFDFLKYLPQEKKVVLEAFKAKGVTGQVWKLISEQANKGRFDKKDIQSSLGISAVHFDKITSELLAKGYHFLFDDDKYALLYFLSTYPTYTRHFYAELNRQINKAEAAMDIRGRKIFYKKCFDLSGINIPIIYTDEKVVAKLGRNYLALFKGEEKKLAKLFVECKSTYTNIQRVFASGKVRPGIKNLQKQVMRLGELPAVADEELMFEYYRTKIFFYHIAEDFTTCLELADEAAKVLKKFNSAANKINLLRLDLKSAEYFYYLNDFATSFRKFDKAFNSVLINKIPDRGYYITKYIQISLITGHTDVAAKLLEGKKKSLGDQLVSEINPREIVSFIKLYLITGQYEQAFRFIQLGFEKNPKGEYFQYEVELRNLQTAYFYLTGQQDTALEMCDRHIKFLRFHKRGIRKSNYPYFYLLIKAIYARKRGYRQLKAKEEEMLHRYQCGSYAIYGKLQSMMAEV